MKVIKYFQSVMQIFGFFFGKKYMDRWVIKFSGLFLTATPGRLVDHLENTKGFNLRSLRYLVRIIYCILID